MAMRRGLLWLFGAVLALTAVVLWVPQRASTIVQAIEARQSARLDAAPFVVRTALSQLPMVLTRTAVEPARHDPFLDPSLPAAPSPVRPVAAVTAPSPPPIPAPPPTPPPLQWRLLGTMATPTGQRLVMLTHNNEQQTVVAEAGVQLDGGYEITAVTADAVLLRHAPLQTEVVIPIPTPQPPPDR
jgi:hypothetical protein